MLAKDADRLSALRMLKSAVGYTQIEKKTDTLSEPDFVTVVQREVKKRRDSIEQFEKGGRPELANYPGTRLSHQGFAPQVVELEDDFGIGGRRKHPFHRHSFHKGSPMAILSDWGR